MTHKNTAGLRYVQLHLQRMMYLPIEWSPIKMLKHLKCSKVCTASDNNHELSEVFNVRTYPLKMTL
jgi:hypothetical protein